ncbi:MAG TPA: G/U mismatch-specific DNA glycosylase [Thermomicrobiales bacterium]|nr:G/U mismatch-specific DNA glycosylase [Thermomicrobiales bacterium]
MSDLPGIVDLLQPGLRVVFCGYNPSLTSGQTGRHYAFPGNRFWRLLDAAAITDRLYRPDEDELLLALGIGFTNIVARPTRRADELTRDEIRDGAAMLREKITRYRPVVMAYTGIGVYRWLRGSSRPTWGVQPEAVVPGTVDLVLPSPSGLNRMTFGELVEHYRQVVPFLER